MAVKKRTRKAKSPKTKRVVRKSKPAGKFRNTKMLPSKKKSKLVSPIKVVRSSSKRKNV